MDRKRQFKMITAHLENLFLVNRETDTHSALIVLLTFLPLLQNSLTVSCSLWTCVTEETAPAGNESVDWGDRCLLLRSFSAFGSIPGYSLYFITTESPGAPRELSTVYCCLCPHCAPKNLKCFKGQKQILKNYNNNLLFANHSSKR